MFPYERTDKKLSRLAADQQFLPDLDGVLRTVMGRHIQRPVSTSPDTQSLPVPIFVPDPSLSVTKPRQHGN